MRVGDVFKDADVVSIDELRAAREAAVVRDDDDDEGKSRAGDLAYHHAGATGWSSTSTPSLGGHGRPQRPIPQNENRRPSSSSIAPTARAPSSPRSVIRKMESATSPKSRSAAQPGRPDESAGAA